MNIRMIKKIVGLILYIGILNSIIAKELSDVVIPMIQSVMLDKNIPVLQIAIFRPGKIWRKEFRMDITTKKIQIVDSDSFQQFFIGELAYPVIANLLLKNEHFEREISILSKKDSTLQWIQKELRKNRYRVSLYDTQKQSIVSEDSYFSILPSFFNMLSGLEVSKIGITNTKAKSIQEKVPIRSAPYESFYLSTENYHYIYRLFLLRKNESLEKLNSRLYRLGLRKTFFYQGQVNSDFFRDHSIPRGTFSGQKISLISDLQIHYPFSYGLISNVSDYYRFLMSIWEPELFRLFYTLSPFTGGYRNGFFYRQVCKNPEMKNHHWLVEANGFFPGYRSYVLLADNGYGFIVFQNSDNESAIHYIRDKIEEIFYQLWKISCVYRSLLKEQFHTFTGYYRSINAIPDIWFLRIFSDIWIRYDANQNVEVSYFFNKDPIGYLYENSHLPWFRGYTKMNRYPFIFVEEPENNRLIVNIYEYKKIPWLFSIRGILILFSFLILVIMVMIIGWLLSLYRNRNV